MVIFYCWKFFCSDRWTGRRGHRSNNKSSIKLSLSLVWIINLLWPWIMTLCEPQVSKNRIRRHRSRAKALMPVLLKSKSWIIFLSPWLKVSYVMAKLPMNTFLSRQLMGCNWKESSVINKTYSKTHVLSFLTRMI